MVSTRGRIESNNLNLVVCIPASFRSIDPQVSSMVIRGVSWDLAVFQLQLGFGRIMSALIRATRQRPARRPRAEGPPT